MRTRSEALVAAAFSITGAQNLPPAREEVRVYSAACSETAVQTNNAKLRDLPRCGYMPTYSLLVTRNVPPEIANRPLIGGNVGDCVHLGPRARTLADVPHVAGIRDHAELSPGVLLGVRPGYGAVRKPSALVWLFHLGHADYSVPLLCSGESKSARTHRWVQKGLAWVRGVGGRVSARFQAIASGCVRWMLGGG